MLTDVALRKLTARERRYSVLDGSGLYIEEMPSGEKYWRFRARVGEGEVRRSLGRYPDVSLRAARLQRDEIRLATARGASPFTPSRAASTLENVAREWHKTQVLPVRTPGHARTIMGRLSLWVFPWLDPRPLSEVSAEEILSVLRRIEVGGKFETCHRVLQILSQIYRYAVASGLATADPTSALRGALVPTAAKHHPTLTAPEDNPGPVPRRRRARWEPRGAGGSALRAFDRRPPRGTAQGRVGGNRRRSLEDPRRTYEAPAAHLVPLSPQALRVLDEIRPLTGGGRYVFPALRGAGRPLSDGTVNAALRRLGYAPGDLTGHGFRSMFSTTANESSLWSPDAIERQLAHAEGNSVRAAYNYAQHMEERTRMMTWWGAWLEGRKAEGVQMVQFLPAAFATKRPQLPQTLRKI